MDYEKLKESRNENNPFCRRLGIYVEEIREGYAREIGRASCRERV